MYANLFFLKYYIAYALVLLSKFGNHPAVFLVVAVCFTTIYGDRFSVIASSVMNAATETWKNGLTMMYTQTETRLPLCFSQRSLVFYSVFSLQILVFFVL